MDVHTQHAVQCAYAKMICYVHSPPSDACMYVCLHVCVIYPGQFLHAEPTISDSMRCKSWLPLAFTLCIPLDPSRIAKVPRPAACRAARRSLGESTLASHMCADKPPHAAIARTGRMANDGAYAPMFGIPAATRAITIHRGILPFRPFKCVIRAEVCAKLLSLTALWSMT